MQPDIIAIGEPMLEFNAEEEGALSDVRRFVAGWGGDTSNFAIAAGRAGGRVGYLTRLGDDEFGESFLKLWQREGIDVTRIVKDPDAFTAAYFISRKGKQHYFTYFRRDSAASRMTPGFLPVDYIAGATLVHVSGISQAISVSASETVSAAIAIARSAGRLVSYDPNFRPKLWPLDRAQAVIHDTCRQADLLFPSLDDARQLTGMAAPEEIARFYLGLGPKVVVVKLGAEGALLATAEGLRRVPPYKVDAVDMSGAGDTFDGAFVASYLAGRPVDECLRFANAAAAITTTGLGCVTPVPRLEEIEAFVARPPQ
ncbi:MAG TPA: sugar kinase [Desulfobacterales bacterium]|nr:sugar kinase [Desulfobacterales bacterium]